MSGILLASAPSSGVDDASPPLLVVFLLLPPAAPITVHEEAAVDVAEIVPKGHAMQAPGPLADLYCPDGQAEQVRLNRHLDGASGNCTK